MKSKGIPIDPTADILAGHKEMAREISRKRWFQCKEEFSVLYFISCDISSRREVILLSHINYFFQWTELKRQSD